MTWTVDMVQYFLLIDALYIETTTVLCLTSNERPKFAFEWLLMGVWTTVLNRDQNNVKPDYFTAYFKETWHCKEKN